MAASPIMLSEPKTIELCRGCTGKVWGERDLGVPAVCVMGTFDGVHTGHVSLIRAAAEEAHAAGAPLVALTFTPAPDEVLSPGEHLHLMGTRGRVAALLAAGVETVVAFDFTQELASLSAAEFVREVLLAATPVRTLHVGDNFRLGRAGATGSEGLAHICAELGFASVSHALLSRGGAPVSSTRIRQVVAAGGVAEAAELLGHLHCVHGRVEHGRGEGTSFGFPTANVACDTRIQMPARGVYACYLIVDGLAWSAAANVGAPPTFSTSRDHFLEANLIGFTGDLYGRAVDVAFACFLRASRRFSSLGELEETVQSNIAWVADNLGTGPIEVRP